MQKPPTPSLAPPFHARLAGEPMPSLSAMPRLPARLGFTLAVACCLLAAAAEAKTFKFPEHDLELQTPEDWLPSPPPPGTVAVIHDQIARKIEGDTSVGSKAVVVMVATFPAGVAIDTGAFVERQREGLQEKGAVVVGTGQRAVGPLLFYTTKLAYSEIYPPGSYVCTATGNDRAVTLVFSSREADPSTDPQLDEILRSVHFLSPYRPVPELTLWIRVKAFTQRHPVAVTALALVGIAAIAVFVVILRQSSAEARPARSSARKS
jgi:hypothetical protein